jgi:hypothetical protein
MHVVRQMQLQKTRLTPVPGLKAIAVSLSTPCTLAKSTCIELTCTLWLALCSSGNVAYTLKAALMQLHFTT